MGAMALGVRRSSYFHIARVKNKLKLGIPELGYNDCLCWELISLCGGCLTKLVEHVKKRITTFDFKSYLCVLISDRRIVE